jgi:hypothetical protein
MSIKKLIAVTKNRFLYDMHIIGRHCRNFIKVIKPRKPSFKLKKTPNEKQKVVSKGNEEASASVIEEKPNQKMKPMKALNSIQSVKNTEPSRLYKEETQEKISYKDRLKDSFRKAKLHTKHFRDEEVKLVIKHLTNRMRVESFVSRVDIDKICVNLNQEKKEVVFDVLAKRHMEFINEELHYSQDFIADKENRMQALLSLIAKTEPPVQNSDNIYLAKLYHEGLVASNFPEQIKPGWLNPILQNDNNMDFVVNIMPMEVQSIVLYLVRKQNALEEEMYQLTKLGRKDPSLKERIKLIEERIVQLKRQEINLHSFSLCMVNKSIDPDEVRRASRRTIQTMMAEGIECKYATHYQSATLRSSIPIGVDFLKGREISVPTKVLKDAFIFKKIEGLE